MQRSLQVQQFLKVLVVLWLALGAGSVRAAEPVARAVLFFSPSCGHCGKVINEDLPPLFEKYGERLQIIGVNTADPGGAALFDAAGNMFNIPPENRGVPLLVIADVALLGSLDIPERLPGLIEQYLAAGGADWPAIPGLAEAIAQTEAAQATPATTAATAATPQAAQLTPTVEPTSGLPAPTATPGLLLAGGAEDGAGPRARFDRDPIGNGLAVIVLAGMVLALGWVVARRPWRVLRPSLLMSKPGRAPRASQPADWAVPLLCLIGLGVAGYLAYVETRQVQAVCGPVGDCNSVQQSAYALLFGLIPVGVVGVLGYLAILAGWAVSRFTAGRIAQWAGLAVWMMALVGVLFSVYLTFLEPFVIGATCAWCLSSAVIMTLLLLLTTARLTGGATPATLPSLEGERQTS